MRSSLLLLLVFWLASSSSAVELKLVHRHGEPIADREKGWSGHVDFASWLDDNRIVFATLEGKISCLSLKSKKIEWALDSLSKIEDWSVSRGAQRLAIHARKGDFGKSDVQVFDGVKGTRIKQFSPEDFAKLVKEDYFIPTAIALTPDDGRLLVCNFSQVYQPSGYILDPTYQKVLKTISVDVFPRELTWSPKGNRLAVIADKEVLCVRDLTADRDLYFRGQRVEKTTGSIEVTIDAPFFSNVRAGDGDTLVYTRDNSWATGQCFILNFKTKETAKLDARNGHIVMDAFFPKQRVVLSGTERNLLLVDFSGKELAYFHNATLQRNMSVEFSPSGKQILVGSWDNTLSVFEIVE